MDVNLKYKGKWIRANVQFTEILTVGKKVIDFNESQIIDYIKMTHIGQCNFKGDMFSAYVPDNEHYAHELVVLFGNINFIYSKNKPKL